MSNETPTDKRKDQLTRIPVRTLFFVENMDIPGGSNQLSNLKGYPFPENNQRYHTIDFLPAWQVFEITAMLGDKVQTVQSDDPRDKANPVPMVRIMPVAQVRTWERFPGDERPRAAK